MVTPPRAFFQLCFLFALFFLAPLTAAQRQHVARVVDVEGTVNKTQVLNNRTIALVKRGTIVNDSLVLGGDTIETGLASRATVQYANGDVFELGPEAKIVVDAIRVSPPVSAPQPPLGHRIRVWFGSLVANIFPGSGVETEVETPVGVAAVKGTVFTVFVDQKTSETRLAVSTGRVEFRNEEFGLRVVMSDGDDLSFQKSDVRMVILYPEILSRTLEIYVYGRAILVDSPSVVISLSKGGTGVELLAEVGEIKIVQEDGTVVVVGEGEVSAVEKITLFQPPPAPRLKLPISIDICEVDGEPCDDGDPCTEKDRCENRECRGVLIEVGGFCDGGNQCTEGGTCVNGGCQDLPVEDGTPCDDGDACTEDDACLSGECLGAPITSCFKTEEP